MALKPVEFRGNALDELRSFPEAARRAAGFQIDRIHSAVTIPMTGS
jgi:phage-related protein